MKINNTKGMENTLKLLEKYADTPPNDNINQALKDLNIDIETINKALTDTAVENVKNELKLITKFKNVSNNPGPTYKYLDDSGFDIRAFLPDGSITILPTTIKLIPTGLFFELPESQELQIRPRSGLALKNGITVLNTPGTVDRGYTGEVKIILINLGKENFKVESGDRIAQGVISPVISGRWSKLERVDSIKNTNRNKGGFGSTGKK